MAASSHDYKIAILGPDDATVAFKALGFHSFNTLDAESMTKKLYELRKGEVRYAIIFVMENLLEQLAPEDYSRLMQGALPAIIPVPGHQGPTGFGVEKIRRAVERAIGSDIGV
ncbi:MAG: V-type ATP synthase subunit F [Patescibacteria group bacterium]|nr:V-type ATP synthase subunit F [Patescibacteria group bacterium]